jgi:hypothetical protein
MITPELARELKEAGFPSQCWRITEYVGAEVHQMTPSLAELIEACGDYFYYLYRGFSHDFWSGTDTLLWIATGEGVRGEGKTNEEAVARLWLAIRKL